MTLSGYFMQSSVFALAFLYLEGLI